MKLRAMYGGKNVALSKLEASPGGRQSCQIYAILPDGPGLIPTAPRIKENLVTVHFLDRNWLSQRLLLLVVNPINPMTLMNLLACPCHNQPNNKFYLL